MRDSKSKHNMMASDPWLMNTKIKQNQAPSI